MSELDNKIQNTLSDFFQNHISLEQDEAIALAVSGGPDSMALAQAFVCVFPDINIHIITVNHGLRDEAQEEAQAVAKWVGEQPHKSLTHVVLNWQGDKPDTGLLEAARHARYGLLHEYCEGHKIHHVFLGHHQDDQAETFLIRLSKGSGLDGLAGMKPVQENNKINLCRPFLNISKADLVSYCTEHDINFAQDPTNENEDYLRPRLRKSMDVLSEEGLTPERLSALSKRLLRARNALNVITEYTYDECLVEVQDNKIILNFDDLKKEPEEIMFRVIVKATKILRNKSDYGIRMDRLENLFGSLRHSSESFKPRTLGGLIFALKDNNAALFIEKEHKN